MSSETITRNDLTNILNEVLPSPTMLKTVDYFGEQITWYSTSNPFCDVITDVAIDGWTPIDLAYTISGSLTSFVYPTQLWLTKVNGVDSAHGYFRMVGQTPSSTTQNTVNWQVTYIKNAPTTQATSQDGTLTTNVYYSRRGSTVMLKVDNYSITNTSNVTLLGTLPAELKPPLQLYGFASGSVVSYVRVDTDGKVYGYRSTAGNLLCSITWGVA